MAIKEKDGVHATIKMMEANHKAELATQAANLKQEMSEKIADARTKADTDGKLPAAFLNWIKSFKSL